MDQVVAHLEPLPSDPVKDFGEEEPLNPLSTHAVLARAKSLAVNLVIRESTQSFYTRYVSLVQVLYEEATAYSTATNRIINWAGLIDDDTFFPSTTRLMNMLGAYNASEPQYIGALSDDSNAFEKWGITAYGGAGIFLSMPLVTQLQHYLPGCLLPEAPNGDNRIAECIYNHTTTKLTIGSGLNQLDIMGDQSGFYEAVRPLPVSVHHWKSWSHYDMVLISSVASITGEDSILQKFHFANGWWMTNGFSIVKYTDEEEGRYEPPNNHNEAGESDAITLHHTPSEYLSHRQGVMENTFQSGYTGKPDYARFLLHSFAPLRPPDEGKLQYMLERAVRENPRTMTFYYVRRVEGLGVGVVRIIWTKG